MVFLRPKRAPISYHSVAINDEQTMSVKKKGNSNQTFAQAKADKVVKNVSWLVAHKTAILVACGIIALGGVIGLGVASQYFGATSSSSSSVTVTVITPPVILASSSSSSSSTGVRLSSSSSSTAAVVAAPTSSSASVSSSQSLSSTARASSSSSTASAVVYSSSSSSSTAPQVLSSSPTAPQSSSATPSSSSSSPIVYASSGVSSSSSSPTVYASSSVASSSSSYSIPPATIPTNFVQASPKLVGSGATGSGVTQGISNALSGDGYTLAIGGDGDNSGIGAVWIYVYSNVTETWTQQGNKLTGTGMSGSGRFGSSVALSDDGNTLAVGGHYDDFNFGAVWLFVRNNGGSTWTQQGSKLISQSGFVGDFGVSVCLTADGNRLAVGASDDQINIDGTVYIYSRSAGVWALEATLLPSDSLSPSSFGASVSFSLDGTILAIGGRTDNSYIGATWIFTRVSSNGTWAQQGSKLVGTGNAGPISAQGVSVALSSDANTLIVGASGEDNNYLGAVWVFERASAVSSFIQTGSKLSPADIVGTSTYFGCTVAISGDGNTFVAGAVGDNSNQGAAFVYIRNGTQWIRSGAKLLGNGQSGNPQRGFGLAMSRNGAVIALGGVGDASGLGATWVFVKETDYCSSSNPCLNGGLCYNTPHSANCNCVNGYSGVTCATNYCIQNPCLHGGTCTNSANSRSCSCVNGYTGVDCEITHCDGNPCNHGNCTHTPSLFTCKCEFGYNPSTNCAQTYCQTDACGRCTSSCTLNSASRTCNCMTGWGGSICTGKTGDEFGTCSYVYSANASICAVTPGNPCGNYACTPYEGCSVYAVSTQQRKITTTNQIGLATFGGALGLSTDGNTLAIGGQLDNSYTGAVWIFIRSFGNWSQEAKLVPSDVVVADGSFFGGTLSLTPDGNTLAVGGSGDNYDMGAVWMFKRSGSSWTQQGSKLVGGGTIGSAIYQGISVSLSSDGNTLAFGGMADNNNIGALWVYTYSGGVWSQQGNKLVASDAAVGTRFGRGVAISGDGNIVAVTGDADSSSIGAVWIMTRSNGVWTQRGTKVTGTGAVGAATFGASIAMSKDATTIAIGAPADDNYKGAFWIFSWANNVLTQVGSKFTVTASSITSAYVGTSIALSDSGEELVVGGYGENYNAGGAWIFTRNSGTWTFQSKLLGTDVTGPQAASQGNKVALSGDGHIMAEAGGGDDSGKGAVWIFV